MYGGPEGLMQVCLKLGELGEKSKLRKIKADPKQKKTKTTKNTSSSEAVLNISASIGLLCLLCNYLNHSWSTGVIKSEIKLPFFEQRRGKNPMNACMQNTGTLRNCNGGSKRGWGFLQAKQCTPWKAWIQGSQNENMFITALILVLGWTIHCYIFFASWYFQWLCNVWVIVKI